MPAPIGYSQNQSGFYFKDDGSGPYWLDSAGVIQTIGGGSGGGGGGSVTTTQLPATLGEKVSSASLSVTQNTDTTWLIRTFRPTIGTGAVVALTAATSSVAQAAAAGTVIRFNNSGSSPIAVEFGTSGVIATANSLIEIQPGTAECFTAPNGATHFAAFCVSAATLKWISGTGV